jgi:hypothetical protein
MKNLTCPNCQSQLEFNLITLRGAAAYPKPQWDNQPQKSFRKEQTPVFFENWMVNEPIGVNCLEFDCSGQLLMRKGEFG